jgi:hypothetical protein
LTEPAARHAATFAAIGPDDIEIGAAVLTDAG